MSGRWESSTPDHVLCLRQCMTLSTPRLAVVELAFIQKSAWIACLVNRSTQCEHCPAARLCAEGWRRHAQHLVIHVHSVCHITTALASVCSMCTMRAAQASMCALRSAAAPLPRCAICVTPSRKPFAIFQSSPCTVPNLQYALSTPGICTSARCGV